VRLSRPLSIRWWLAGLVAAVALPLLLLLAWIYAGDVRREEDEARAIALRIARATATRIEAVHRQSPDGTPAGTLLRQIPGIVGREALPPETVVTIVDRNGTIVARSLDGQTWSGRNARDAPVVSLTLTQREGIAEAAGVDGVARQYGFTTVPELGWHIYVGIPTEALMRPARQMLFRGVGGGLAMLLLLSIVAFAVVRQIERPIRDLSRAAKSLARGNYVRLEPTEGPLEIVALAAGFNEMVERRLGAEEQMREGEQKLKALSDRLLVAQEEERGRIARELHDDLGQSLTALKMDIIGLLQRMPAGESSPIAERIVRTIDVTVTAVQRISSELRPSVLDDLGLVAAIESEALLFEERTGIECELSLAVRPSTSEHPEGTPIEPGTATAIYRIVQEALTNVARHSNAARVEIRLREREDEILLEVRDDGGGITRAQIDDPASLGLIGIRERADLAGGDVEFEGVDGRGTIVSLRIPLPAGANR
jgi:signal transduction histidine kinase